MTELSRERMDGSYNSITITVSTDSVPLTPLGSALRESTARHEALLSMNFSARPEGVFIHTVQGGRDEIQRRIADNTDILRACTSAIDRTRSSVHAYASMGEDHLLHRLLEYPIIVDTPVEYDEFQRATVRIFAPNEMKHEICAGFTSDKDVNIEKITGFQPIRDTPLDALSERQEEILRTAYRAGYYDYPRSVDSADLAERFEIEPTTVNEHLRVAESKLMTRLAVLD